MRVLIVEDDPLLGEGLARGLAALGFAVDWFGDGQQADTALVGTEYDAVVLDLGLPGRDGLEWLKRWRTRGLAMPVLVLTARDALEQRIEGLDTGADDYLIKPCETAEIAARLRAVLRRSAGRADPAWQHGPLVFKPEARSVSWNGAPVELTARETALLELLMANPQRVMARRVIEDKLYAFGQEIESNALEVHIHHLRRKLHPKIVRTVRGVGYALGDARDLA